MPENQVIYFVWPKGIERDCSLDLQATRGLCLRQAWPLFDTLHYSAFMGSGVLGFFAGSTVRLLRSHAACQPGVLLVTFQASAGMLLNSKRFKTMSGALFSCIIINILAF